MSYDVSREGSLASVEFLPVGGSTTTVESSSQGDQASFAFRQIASDVDVNNYTMGLNTPNGDPRAWQISQKFKALGLMLQGKMITGAQISGATFVGGASLAALTFVSAQGFDMNAGPSKIKYTNSGTTWQFCAPGDLDYGAAVTAASNGTYTLSSANASKKIVVTIVAATATANTEGVVNFTTSTNEPDGLAKLCPSSQIVASTGTNGDAISFDVLDRLIYEKVKIRENLVFIMNATQKRKYMALARTASGGLTPSEIAIPVMGMSGGIGNKMVPAYNGIPILQVDDIPATESKGGSGATLSSVYLVSLAPKVGFFGAVQAGGGFEDIALDPYTSRVAGCRLYDLGQRDSKAAWGTRVEWIGGYGLGSPLAVARASELTP